jgi:polyisoprenoid-binding protein YceI
MMRRLLCWLLCTLPLAAAESTVELDPARTAINFTLTDVLHTVHGSFKLKRGSITFDSSTGKASGEIVVDVASGNSGNRTRDRRMHKEILQSMRYPEAVFAADRVTGELAPRGTSELDVHGAFQIHGASHEMTLHFRAAVNGSEVASSTGFTIPYVQWGIKNPSNFLLRVSDKVEMNIQAVGRLR